MSTTRLPDERFRMIEAGEVGMDVVGADLSGSTAAAVIAVSSVSTGNEMRDNHLRSADFFDAGRYPGDDVRQQGAAPGGRLVGAVG